MYKRGPGDNFRSLRDKFCYVCEYMSGARGSCCSRPPHVRGIKPCVCICDFTDVSANEKMDSNLDINKIKSIVGEIVIASHNVVIRNLSEHHRELR